MSIASLVPNSSGGSPGAAKGSSLTLALENTSGIGQGAAFWYHADISLVNWDQNFPYQLYIVQRTNGAYRIYDKPFTLPINPEGMSYEMPYAADGQVTLGGYYESNNGIPIRNIQLTASFGVLPLRGTGDPRRFYGLTNFIQAGSIASAVGVTSITGDRTSPNLVSDADLAGNVGKASGWYQYRLLKRWLENYAEMKKKVAYKDYRLAFAMWKDEAVYLITPLGLSFRKAAASPMETTYSLSLRAYRRIKLGGCPPAASPYVPVARNLPGIQGILNTISNARAVLQNFSQAITGLSQDINSTLFTPLQQVSLFLKDVMGATVTMADFPSNIIRGCAGAIASLCSLSSTAQTVFSTSNRTSGSLGEVEGEIADAYNEIVTAGGQPVSPGMTPTGALPSSGGGGAIGSIQQAVNAPAIQDPNKYFRLLNLLPVGQMQLSPASSAQMAIEKQNVRLLTRNNFQQMRDNISSLANDYACSVGGGSAAYQAAYGLSPLPDPSSKKIPSDEDMEVLFALNGVVTSLDKLAASSTINPVQFDPVAYVAGLSSAAGIAFRIPRSKFLVPFPYGIGLEELAQMYLGDSTRWNEIATLNGLRFPYVDEEGFDLPLLVNASADQVVVSSADHLILNQPVWLSANLLPRIQRTITNIEKLSSQYIILTLSGGDDLSTYTKAKLSTLHVFLPNTVNSQQQIYIPSDENSPYDDDPQTKGVPGVNEFDPLFRAGGADLLLTQDGDLVVTPDGDCRLAVALTNIVQSCKIRLGLQRGSLRLHPEIGLSVKVGMSTADFTAADLYESVNKLFADDPAIGSVVSTGVEKKGPVAKIGVVLKIADSSTIVPISATINP